MKIKSYQSIDVVAAVSTHLNDLYCDDTIHGLLTEVLSVTKPDENECSVEGCEIVVVASYSLSTDPNLMRQTLVFIQV